MAVELQGRERPDLVARIARDVQRLRPFFAVGGAGPGAEDLAELPGAAALLLVAMDALGRTGDRLAIGNARRLGIDFQLVLTSHLFKLGLQMDLAAIHAEAAEASRAFVAQYGKAAGTYPWLTVNALNPWALLGSGGDTAMAEAGYGRWSSDIVGLLGPVPIAWVAAFLGVRLVLDDFAVCEKAEDADIIVVNKADRDGADHGEDALERLDLSLGEAVCGRQ